MYVDRKTETVLIPISGVHVPFHVATIKSVSKTEEAGLAFLRINFFAPGVPLGKDVPGSMHLAFQNKEAMFIRTINIKSKVRMCRWHCRHLSSRAVVELALLGFGAWLQDHKNLNLQSRVIKDIQKRLRVVEEDEMQTVDLVKQPDLKIDKTARVPKLHVRSDVGFFGTGDLCTAAVKVFVRCAHARFQDVMMWPQMSGRKTEGVLEAHINGFRFISNKGERIDIIYGNVKHAIYQPCEGEHVVLVHFHLKKPILVGKKKAKDIQFFTEVVEASQVLDNRNKSVYDPDELEEEDKERMLRHRLNKAFKKFVEQVWTDGAFCQERHDVMTWACPWGVRMDAIG